jgi:hypothetical protein
MAANAVAYMAREVNRWEGNGHKRRKTPLAQRYVDLSGKLTRMGERRKAEREEQRVQSETFSRVYDEKRWKREDSEYQEFR